MISYDKLRTLIFKRQLKISNVCVSAGLSHYVGVRINKDQSIELKSLEKICLYLGIPIQDSVEFIKDDQ